LNSAAHIPEEIHLAGDLRIDVGRHQVTREGVEIALPNLSFELLLALARAHPRMVTTEELLETVWARVVVNPETVSQRVKLLRQALGEDARAPRYVVGVRGRGYRMEVPVTRGVQEPADPAPAAQSQQEASDAQVKEIPTPSVTGPLPGRTGRGGVLLLTVAVVVIAGGVLWGLRPKGPTGIPTTTEPAQSGASLAVLPFVDMSAQHDQQYFSDGLAEELINQLAQLPSLRVVGRTSSFALRGRNDDLRKISATLNVNHVLEGSVRKDGSRVRIAVQLIDSSNGSYVWSHTYERTLDDIFAIQEDIARAVAKELQVRIDDRAAARGETRNYAAFDELLTGRALLNSNDASSMGAAVAHLEKAVALDTGYLDAWIWLIDSYTRKAVGDVEDRAETKSAQQRAIARVSELAPNSVYAAIADSYGALSDGRVQDAGRLLEATLSAPAGIRARVSMRYGQFLLSTGRGAAAVEQLTRTRAADPLDMFLRTQLILALEVSGQRDRADAEATELLSLPGGDTILLRGDRVARAIDRGDLSALKTALAEQRDRPGGLAEHLVATLDDPGAARRELQRVLDDPAARSDVFTMTSVMQWAAFLRDPELSLRAADQAAKLGVSFETWSWSIWRPVMKDVRRQPAFKALLQEMGLVDYWRATGYWSDFCRPVRSQDFECT
jgi:TolB-like protein/DNA-binding winged helix-turn-helix (wHTH) protein